MACGEANEGEVCDVSILFDLAATQPLRGQAHGGAEYAKALFKQLIAWAGPGRIKGCYDPHRPLEPDVREVALAGHVALLERPATSAIGRLAQDHGCDRLVSVMPYDLHDADLTGLDVFLTVHGLRFVEYPVDSQGWRYTGGIAELVKWMIKLSLPGVYAARQRGFLDRVLNLPARSLTIVVPSQHTRFSILDEFPNFDTTRIRVLYCPETAVSLVEPTERDVRQIGALEPKRYILIVSGSKWIKNAYRALEAAVGVIESQGSGEGLKLAIAGGAPRKMPKRWRRHVVELGRLSTSDLAICYRDAFCLMYPTLNEGFGYPPLEAMARGTPVLCSAITSTTEVLGDAAVYFAPKSIQEMRVRLRMLLEDDGLRAEYAARGRARHALVAERQRRDQDELCALIVGARVGA